MSDALALGSLLLWGACVSLDERGLFASTLGSPIVAGLGAGLLVRDVSAGVAFGLLFQALYPVRVESGGQIPPAAGLASLSAVSFLWAASVRFDALFVMNGINAGQGALVVGSSARLAEAAAASSAIPLFALVMGIAIAEAARRLEQLLRARNTRREETAVPGLESSTAANGSGSVEGVHAEAASEGVIASSKELTAPIRGGDDLLGAIRRAQVRAILESGARGAGIVLFAVALGWPLRDAPVWIESTKPVANVWRGLLWVAPLLGAAFLLRDLPLVRRGFESRSTAAPKTRFGGAVKTWIQERRLWVVTLLGVGLGAIATGWLG